MARFPRFRGIVQHPIIRHDGTIFQADGYDPETELLFVKDGTVFPPVKEAPTEADARAALCTLLKPIAYMPYVPDNGEIRERGVRENGPSAARSVALSAMLSVVARYSVPIAPMFAFTAPRPGEAKTTHSDILSQMIEGQMAPITPVSENQDEFEKQFKAALRSGESLITLNNVTKAIGDMSLLNSATLDAGNGVIKFREFGTLGNREVPGYRIFTVNGIRLEIKESMKRRVLLCEIDSGDEKPQLLKYPFNPRLLAHDMRAELIHAALTILRGHHNSGRKAPPGRVFDGFGPWDEWVAGALVGLREPDPLQTQKAIEGADDERASIARFFAALREEFPGQSVGAACPWKLSPAVPRSCWEFSGFSISLRGFYLPARSLPLVAPSLAAGGVQRLNTLKTQAAGLSEIAQKVAQSAVPGAIVLGILGLTTKTYPNALTFVGLLLLGAALSVSSAALSRGWLRYFTSANHCMNLRLE